MNPTDDCELLHAAVAYARVHLGTLGLRTAAPLLDTAYCAVIGPAARAELEARLRNG